MVTLETYYRDYLITTFAPCFYCCKLTLLLITITSLVKNLRTCWNTSEMAGFKQELLKAIEDCGKWETSDLARVAARHAREIYTQKNWGCLLNNMQTPIVHLFYSVHLFAQPLFLWTSGPAWAHRRPTQRSYCCVWRCRRLRSSSSLRWPTRVLVPHTRWASCAQRRTGSATLFGVLLACQCTA